MRLDIDRSILNWLLVGARRRTDESIDRHLRLRKFRESYPQMAGEPSPLSHEVLRLDAEAEFALAKAWLADDR